MTFDQIKPIEHLETDALIGADFSVSARQLTTLVERLAGEIGSAERGGAVAILAEPGIVPSTAAIAALAAQRPYLPIAASYPEERIKYILEDSGATTVLTASSEVDRARSWGYAGLTVVDVEALLRDIETEDPTGTDHVWDLVDLNIQADKPAYLIYTSGSTGDPKGIVVSRANLANQLDWLRDMEYLTVGTRIIQKTPIGFDAAQWEILAPLAGAEAVIVQAGEHRDPYALVARMQHAEATTLQGVPTLLHAIVETGELPKVTSLRRIFSGGEALSWDLVAKLQQQLPDLEVVNLYGPTECTINATSFSIPAGGLQQAWTGTNSVPIGKPVSNVEYSVMEDGPEGPVAAEVGELWLFGAQIAIGYQGMPEETARKFPVIDGRRCYRTGDRVRKLEDGNLEFLGRFDNQVKIRGNRVELDEIAAQFHRHPWVERAHALLLSGRRPGQQELVACIQLDPGNAPLMDGAQAASHHRSKADRTQVKAQLSSPGLRDVDGIPEADVFSIPGSGSEERIEAHTYARKTYRFFDGPRARQREILKLIAAVETDIAEPSLPDPDTYRASVLDMLHAVSAHHSPERLLPKYLYASPGALYSTQIYLENDGTLGIPPGMYYFQPVERQLYLLPDQSKWNPTGLRFHLVSKTSAIQDVYEKNVKEVQLLEAGHLLGAMEQFAARHDAHVHFEEPEQSTFPGQESDDDVYLGTVELRTSRQPWLDDCDFYISIPDHTTMPLEPGMYKHTGQNELQRISDHYVRQNEVIAINQAVYSRADFGVAIVSEEEDPRHAYISMGYQMHKIQDNDLKFGFMSAGYSSFSGHPLPSALTIQKALGVSDDGSLPSYFALGGHISDEQIEHRGMNEDSVHMTGPAEMITKDMANYVPDYMVPDRSVLVAGFPTTPNGKIDARALEQSPEVTAPSRHHEIVEPSTATEELLVRLWQSVLKVDDVSADDNFFQIGGDSIRVMMVLAKLKEEARITIGPETVFSNPVLNDLASAIDEGSHASRLIPLSDLKPGPATIAWPGLGGVPINLKPLALNLQTESTVYGVRASGINPDEPIHRDVHEMARHDIELIPDRESYRLIGYSFGCRVAFEAAFQLENWGKNVESLVLVCPGNPAVELGGEPTGNRDASFDNREFVAMLTSVFTGRIDTELISKAWETVTTPEDMVTFVTDHVEGFEASQVRRIVDLVSGTYEFDYSFTEMADLKLKCPVLIIKAAGDLYSSVEDIVSGGGLDFDEKQLTEDHYTVLREPGVQTLAATVREFQLKHSHAEG